MEDKRIHIDWDYSGKPDGFFGTGANWSEQALVWFFGVTGTILLGWLSWSRLAWTWWQFAFAALFALDVLGGVVANALNSCKRFYHAPLQPAETGLTAFAKKHTLFTIFHIHPLLVGWLFGTHWVYGLFWYAALVGSSLLVLRMPLYLQRPAALGLIMTAILVNLYAMAPVAGFEWLVPAIFLKIVYGHIVREEPYRP